MAAAASGSKALLSDCCLDGFTLKNGHVSNSAKQVCFSFNKRSLYSGSRASMSVKNRKPSNDNLHCGYFMFDAMRKSCDYCWDLATMKSTLDLSEKYVKN